MHHLTTAELFDPGLAVPSAMLGRLFFVTLRASSV